MIASAFFAEALEWETLQRKMLRPSSSSSHGLTTASSEERYTYVNITPIFTSWF